MQSVALLLEPGFSMISFDALTVFEVANFLNAEPIYEIKVISEDGGNVFNSIGVGVATAGISSEHYDTLLIGAGLRITTPSANLANYLRATSKHTRRLGSICLGAFTLAATGLLANRKVTTHWAKADELQKAYPDVNVEHDRVFISDGGFWSSGGMSAGIDLALAMVERDVNNEFAMKIARQLALPNRRIGGETQISVLLTLNAKSDRVHNVLSFAKSHLSQNLSVERLAEVACLSPRQFTRLFRDETGTSPAKAIEELRLEAALFMLEQGRLPIEMIASDVGFGDRERMRRAFLRTHGQTPQSIRVASGRSAYILSKLY